MQDREGFETKKFKQLDIQDGEGKGDWPASNYLFLSAYCDDDFSPQVIEICLHNYVLDAVK